MLKKIEKIASIISVILIILIIMGIAGIIQLDYLLEGIILVISSLFPGIFLVVSLLLSIAEARKGRLIGFFCYLFFGIGLSLFALFVFQGNIFSAVFVILSLFLVFGVIYLKYKIDSFVICDVVALSAVGIVLCVLHSLNIEYSKLIYIILGIGIYLLPIFSFFDRKKKTLKKIKICTKEVEAKIINVCKSRVGYHDVYIPELEFVLNGKKYNFIDGSISFRNEIFEGDIIKLFVNPDSTKFDTPNDYENVLLPNSYDEQSFRVAILIWYIVTIVIFCGATILNLISK